MKNKFKLILSLLLSLILVSACLVGGIMVFANNPDPLDADLDGVVSEAYLGEEIEIAVARPDYPSNVESINSIVLSPSGKTVELVNNAFLVEEAGDYEIFYGINGLDGSSKTISYTVNASIAEFPVLTTAPVIPNGVVDGQTYKAPKAIFTDYNSGSPVITNYTVIYVDGNGVESQITDTFTPNCIFSGSNVGLIYRSTSSIGKTNELKYEFPVLKAKSVNAASQNVYNFGEMFLKTNVEDYELVQEGTNFYGATDFSLTYVNYLDANLSMVLRSTDGYAYFDKVRITLTDSVKKTQSIQIDVETVNNSSSKVSVNGGSSVPVNSSLLNASDGLRMAFDNDEMIVEFGDVKLPRITQTAFNRQFFGFNSNLVSIKIEVIGVDSTSLLCVDTFNNHKFNGNPTIVDGQIVLGDKPDFVAPSIVLSDEIKVSISYGEEIIVPSALAMDVIDVAPTASVSLTFNGQPITATDGTLLQNADAGKVYSYLPTKTGRYDLNYVVKDESGNEFVRRQILYVKDFIAPTLEVKGNLSIEAEVGDKITIPEFTYSDNLTEQNSLKAFVLVHTPYSSAVFVTADEEFELEKAGVYYIRYTVYDEFYNMANAEIKVVCK